GEEIDDGAVGIADVVHTHEWHVGDSEDAVEWAAGGLAECLVDAVDGDVLLGLEGEVDDGDVGGGHAHGDAIDSALELGEHERGCASGAGGGRDDGECGGA